MVQRPCGRAPEGADEAAIIRVEFEDDALLGPVEGEDEISLGVRSPRGRGRTKTPPEGQPTSSWAVFGAGFNASQRPSQPRHTPPRLRGLNGWTPERAELQRRPGASTASFWRPPPTAGISPDGALFSPLRKDRRYH